MEYNPNFVKFFIENWREIITNSEYWKDISQIQRSFNEIEILNAGRRITLEVAQSYIKKYRYRNVNVGNERLEERIGEVNYSQKDFDMLQELYNEGEMRDFSSIPRVVGENNGYTYEILRLDDPLAITIGTLTDCCQEINGAAKTSMKHSVVSPDGRVFVVRDEKGRIVAQSWVWRNQYTLCFDNIEIPERIFKAYAKEHGKEGRRGLTQEVLEVYKKAAQELIQEDERVYKKLLENGTITQEQYDSLLLGKVTIGLGYNDIADAISYDTTLHKDKKIQSVKRTKEIPNVYTDAGTQYVVAGTGDRQQSNYDNIYAHQDDIQVYDESNFDRTIYMMMIKMGMVQKRENILGENDNNKTPKDQESREIISAISSEYDFNEEETKVMATARIALVYSEEEDIIRIGDIFNAPIKKYLTPEQIQKVKNHLNYQFKKALKQLKSTGKRIDYSGLSKRKLEILKPLIEEIEKEARNE